MSQYKTVHVEHLDSKEEGDRFIDSLKTAGVDTIIGYYDGCSGCVRGLKKPYFVFWDSGKKWYLTKFTRYARFNNISGYTPPFKYLLENLNAIENDSLKKPQFELSHFPYDFIRIILQDNEIQYGIQGNEKWENESTPKVILIDKIRSKLFDIPPGIWKGLNFKSEKRKKQALKNTPGLNE